MKVKVFNNSFRSQKRVPMIVLEPFDLDMAEAFHFPYIIPNLRCGDSLQSLSRAFSHEAPHLRLGMM